MHVNANICPRQIALRMVFIATLLFAGRCAFAVDTDGDGIEDVLDNCVFAANPSQLDGDNDGVGNRCDADLNQDCTVNVADLGLFRSLFFSADPVADFNGDGVVAITDLGILRVLFFKPVGTSGLENNCAADLVVSGTTAVPAGAVTAQVDASERGGGITTFTTTANALGEYVFTLPAAQGSDFVTLTAQGVANQAVARLRSAVGSVVSLRVAGGDDGSVDATENRALHVSALTTSLAFLAQAQNGGPLTTDRQLAEAIDRIDSTILLDRATLVRVLIDDTSIEIPAGVSDTQELLMSPPALGELRVGLQLDHPDVFEMALSAVIVDNTVEYGPGELPETLLGLRNNPFGSNDAYQITFNGDQTGTYASPVATTPMEWQRTAAGRLSVSPPPGYVESLVQVQIEDPNNPGFFIQADRETIIENVEIVRLVDGERGDHVFVLPSGFIRFPDYPQIPAEIISTETGIGSLRVGLNERSLVPFSPSDVADSALALNYYHTDNASLGVADPRFGFDTLDFSADGSGQTRRRDFAFTWDIDVAGVLAITFANGEQSVYRQFAPVNEAGSRVLVQSSLLTGELLTYAGTAIETDPAAGFTNTGFADRRYRSSLVTRANSTSFGGVFDFQIAPDGSACRNPFSTSSTWNWEVVDGRAEITRPFNFGGIFIFRTWEPVRRVGNDVWVLETLQVPFDDPLIDASITPGRLNLYPIEQVLTNNQRPALNDDEIFAKSDTPRRIFFRELFGNDADPEGDELFFMGISGSQTVLGGSLTAFEDPQSGDVVGLFYTPPPGLLGETDSFTYRASDLACPVPNGDTATVTINIQ